MLSVLRGEIHLFGSTQPLGTQAILNSNLLLSGLSDTGQRCQEQPFPRLKENIL